MNMEERPESTMDKILSVAIDLMAVKGYKAVSIKEIAEMASVSEMTVYRHFGTKKELLNAILSKFQYSYPMQQLFDEKIQWDLEKDLMLICKVYYELMEKNKKVYLISISEKHEMPEIHENINKAHPVKLKKLLTEYFIEMQKKGKVIQGNPEIQALIVMHMNYGKFVSCTFGGNYVANMPLEQFLPEAVRTLVRGLTP